MFLHERAGWPELTWNAESLTSALARVRFQQGKHLARMEALGFELRAEAGLVALTEEVVKSSSIEGERLDLREVRSSIARRMGLEVGGLPAPSRAVEGVVEMMLDATTKFEEPLTPERLFAWHAALFPTGRSGMRPITVGAWRTDQTGPMQVVSGPIGREHVHFEAPPAARLAWEMDRFLSWFNRPIDIDAVLKAGVAHFWFVTIHPFDDGNGRIARAIAELALCRADGTKDRFYSMSSGIESERKSYYKQIESSQRGPLDITPWLVWFVGCLGRTLDQADQLLDAVIHKARLWQRIHADPVNARQRKVINRLFGDFQGYLTTSKYAKIAKCSDDTALRDIHELVSRGVLLRNPGGGRSTSYRLAGPRDVVTRPPR